MTYYQADGHEMLRGIRFLLAICSIALILASFGAQNAWPTIYTLKPFDTITCKFIENPQLNEDLLIPPDGMITLRTMGKIRAAGLRPQDLAKSIENKFVEAKTFSKDDEKGDPKIYKLVTVHLVRIHTRPQEE
jgi:protein involved in polysaccharide export with SLBB domain